MGHVLTREGLQPDATKVTAVRDMEVPAGRKELMRFIGMATFLSRYVPGFSEITAPLRELLKKENEFHWDDTVHGTAFRWVKEMLTSAPVLNFFDVQQPIVIQADCSQNGIGAAIFQGGRPVEYASRALTSTERDSYAQIEKECLACLFALERFHCYVFGAGDVTVENDHRPLMAIKKKALTSAPRRLQRMLLRMQKYEFNLVYKPGSQLIVADTLSRAFQPSTEGTNEFTAELAALSDGQQIEELRMVASDKTISAMKKAAAEDTQYKQLYQQVVEGWPADPSDVPTDLREFTTFADELCVSDGLIFKGQRVVVPRGARDDILQRIHSSHIGINGCIRRAREAVFFPGITKAIKDLVARCEVCETYQHWHNSESH